MASAGNYDLYRACCDGDINTVNRLLPQISVEELKTLRDDGISYLHAACKHGHADIAQQLLEHGATRQIKDSNGHTPIDVSTTPDVQQLLCPPPDQHLSAPANAIKTARLEWLYSQHIAEYFGRAFLWNCIKDRGVERTVKKIRKAGIVPVDLSKESKIFEYYMEKALQTNDPLYLLQSYTTEGPFYRTLNQYMAKGGKRKVFKKLCGKWSGYFIGLVILNPRFHFFHYSGITYRGMEVTEDDIKQYKLGLVLANKAFQSTTKLRDVTYPFAHRQYPKPGTSPAVITYKLVDKRCALDISSISEYPDEQEVLIVPGTCFQVVHVDVNDQECQFHLVQLEWTE